MLFSLIILLIIIKGVRDQKGDFHRNFHIDGLDEMEDFVKTSDFADSVRYFFSYVTTDSPASSTHSAGNSLADTALAKIAICYYIARADGSIGRAEQMVLDNALSGVLNDNRIPQSFRDELVKIANDSGNSFLFVEQYLNKVKPELLVSFLEDARAIASADNRISVDEQKALNVFEKYLEGKTGRTFFAGSTIDTRCDNCGATMKINPDVSQINCPYCGHVKMLRL
ncbi:MAG: TerB family tellurite resistance protein [Clostridia bacterium]|nr:TerB family tellurite resistance protein [Clostridia bacterium]